MKLKVFLVLALAICLSSSLALATTINQPWSPVTGNTSEINLVDIVNGWTSGSFTNAQLEAASNLGTLPGGSYTLLDWASYSAYSQTLDVPTVNLANTPPNNVNNTGVNIAFTEAAAFAFTDTANNGTNNLNLATDGTGDTNRLAGLIIDLGAINASLSGHYLVAFEDGNASNQNSAGVYLGDQDYNDMVAHVVPLPGAILLLGAGMVRLVAYARRRKED